MSTVCKITSETLADILSGRKLICTNIKKFIWTFYLLHYRNFVVFLYVYAVVETVVTVNATGLMLWVGLEQFNCTI